MNCPYALVSNPRWQLIACQIALVEKGGHAVLEFLGQRGYSNRRLWQVGLTAKDSFLGLR